MTSSDVSPIIRIADGIEELVKEVRNFHFPEPKPEPKPPVGFLGEAFALGIAKGFAKTLREALDGDHNPFDRAQAIRDVLEQAENVVASLQKTVDKARKEAEENARGDSERSASQDA